MKELIGTNLDPLHARRTPDDDVIEGVHSRHEVMQERSCLLTGGAALRSFIEDCPGLLRNPRMADTQCHMLSRNPRALHGIWMQAHW